MIMFYIGPLHFPHTNALCVQDPRITRLVDSTDISLLPSLNPDGWDRATEGECSGTGRVSGAANDNGVDINTDFPGPEAGPICCQIQGQGAL